MNRPSFLRLAALVAAVAVVMSCDAGSPTGLGEVGENPDGGGSGGGGGGGVVVGGDGRQPVVVIDTPSTYGQLVNVGDSVLVAVRLRDASGIRSVVVSGLSYKGDPSVGTQVITERYETVNAPLTGTFPPTMGARADTVIRRILFPETPVDSLPDSLVIRAIAMDHSGISDTAWQVVRLVAGPRLQILTPFNGDSVRPGTRVNIQFRATHPDGVAEAHLRVQGSANWPTPLNITFPTMQYTGAPREVLDTASFLIPADAPMGTRLTITADAIDVNQTPGAASPVVLRIRTTESAPPMVRQTVPARAERNDSVRIDATGGNGIAQVGFIVRDSAGKGAELVRRTLNLPGSDANVGVWIGLSLPASMQGKTVGITSFAVDASGRTGYSVSATATTPVTVAADAYRDTSFIVYGSTFPLPRPGTAGDLAVDALRGHVFVSNTRYNRLEVWQASANRFDANGVSTGAEPWGLSVAANNPNELLVANSGGTNISRVNIGSTTIGSIGETSRILTRNTVAYSVTETRDEKTGKIRIVLEGPYSYSDRPQYIAQSAGGRIYYSTRPTATAPQGTLRYLDPTQAVPDSRQIYNYGAPVSNLAERTLFNVDAAAVEAAPADSPLSDRLIICDHASGTADASVCAGSRFGILSAMDSLRAAVPTTDAVVTDVEIESLGLTDTTFVTWSGDRNWIGFAEGNAGVGARVMLANDPAGTAFNNIFFSPGLDVRDLVDNASERVFGIALDAAGRSLAVHGAKTYFGAVERPFHLRMQGQFDSFDVGSGVAYHPQANVDPAVPGIRNDPTRLAFVASNNGTIEIVDAYYFVSRGRVAVKHNLYGPLRASLPLTQAERDAGIAVKLYGLTDRGLVVIDVSTADIKDVP